MTVRDMINKLIEFDPDDNVEVVLSEYYVDDGPTSTEEDDDEFEITDVVFDDERLSVVIEVE